MDDDVDIYGDLPSFDASQCLKCTEKFKVLTEKNARFEEETLSWKNKCETFETEKKTILLNTSSLLKTARAEIARKDKIIVELRRELEDLKFKRGVWSRTKANHKEPTNRRRWAEQKANDEGSSNPMIKPWLNNNRSFIENIVDEDEADADQKWEPNRQISTLYGERLKKKIQSEEEMERKQREEAKSLASNDPLSSLSSRDSTKLTVSKQDIEQLVKIETPIIDDELAETNISCKKEDSEKCWDEQGYSRHQERTRKGDQRYLSSDSILKDGKVRDERDKPNESMSYNVKLEYPMDDPLGDRSDQAGLWDRKNTKSASSSVHSFEGEYKNHRYDRRYNETSNSRDERCKDDYYHHENSNHNHDWRHNPFLDTPYDHRSRHPRDAFIHSEQDKKGRKHQEPQENRQIYEKRSKSNHRGRSKTPDRRHNENSRNDRHRRSEKYKDHNDRYEKRRDDGLPRDRYDSKDLHSKDSYDLRKRLERKYDDKFIDRSDYDNHRNYDSDTKRRARSRSPTDKSRSKSSGASSCQDGKRDVKRSRSRGRSHNIESKKRPDKKEASRERKVVDDEPRNREPTNLQSKNIESSKKTNSAQDGMKMRATNEEDPCEKSTEPLAEAETSSAEQKREESIGNTVAAPETLTNSVNPVEAQDKFILMLENDSEMPLSTLTRPEVEPVGSRSFREEKIENIEKFIQDYQCDEMHCNALGNDETSEHNEENEFANSTSSIVDTLSMDIDDLAVDKNLEEGIVVDSVNGLGIITGNMTEDPKLAEDSVDKEADGKTSGRRLEQVEIDKKNDDVGVDEKSEAADKELAGGESHEENVDNGESHDRVIHGRMEEAVIDEKLEESPMEDKIEEQKAFDANLKDVADDNQSGELVVDGKLEDGEIDEEPKDSIIDEKSEAGEIDANLKVTMDRKTVDVKAVENSEGVDRDVESRVAAIDRESEATLSDKNVAVDEKSAIVEHKVSDVPKDISIENNSKDDGKSEDAVIDFIGKSNDIRLENTDSIDRKLGGICGQTGSIVTAKAERGSEEISLDGNPKASASDKKSAIDEESVNSIDKTPVYIDEQDSPTATESKKVADKKLDDIEIGADTEDVFLKKTPTDNFMDKKSNDIGTDHESADISLAEKSENVETLAKSDNILSTVSPPLPPPLSLPTLPQLPPSPPPEEKEPEVHRKISTVGSGGQETEKSLSKQTKTRPRIPCLPIVSLYSRKRRNLVLTDSASSHTIVRSLNDPTPSDIEMEKVKSSKILGTEKKIIPNSTEECESSKSKKIPSDNSPSSTITTKTGLKVTAVNVIEASNVFSSKNIDPAASKPDGANSESSGPEVRRSSSVATNKDRNKSKDKLPNASSSSKRKIAEKSSEETRSEAESKKVEKSKNSDKGKTSRNSTSTKSSERGKRSVLKTIVSKVPDSESTAGSRKRPLSKEKENQSKPAKQAKIIVVTRRRSVQLEDSSTVTTLVSSEREESFMEYASKNPARNDVSTKKGCVTNT